MLCFVRALKPTTLKDHRRLTLFHFQSLGLGNPRVWDPPETSN